MADSTTDTLPTPTPPTAAERAHDFSAWIMESPSHDVLSETFTPKLELMILAAERAAVQGERERMLRHAGRLLDPKRSAALLAELQRAIREETPSDGG